MGPLQMIFLISKKKCSMNWLSFVPTTPDKETVLGLGGAGSAESKAMVRSCPRKRATSLALISSGPIPASKRSAVIWRCVRKPPRISSNDLEISEDFRAAKEIRSEGSEYSSGSLSGILLRTIRPYRSCPHHPSSGLRLILVGQNFSVRRLVLIPVQRLFSLLASGKAISM